MSALLWIAILAADESQMMVDSSRARAELQCRTAIASKVKAEVSELSVGNYRKIGRTTILNGTVTALQRPVTRPGEMAPMHIINLRYYYHCRWGGRGKAHIKLLSQNN
jgi:hypothetical protein